VEVEPEIWVPLPQGYFVGQASYANNAKNLSTGSTALFGTTWLCRFSRRKGTENSKWDN